jgi:4-amino-4-deoxychorismate lyase
MRHGVLVEGVEADGDCLFERAFQFGDGLFETVAVVDGNPCLWNAHMARLAEGCRRLRLPEPDFRLLAEEARRLCAGHRRVVLKVFWTAGRSQRGYRRPAPVAPRRMLQCSEWPGGVEGRSWELRRCAYRLGENPALAGIKHLNRLDQVVARAEWKDADFSEGLLLGQDGRVVCGTMSNIFVQRGDVLFTPVIDGAGPAR